MARIDLRIVDRIAWLASKPKRIKIAVGGRGSSKSTGVGDLMIKYADDGERICCAREFQNSIDDSVHENLKQEIIRLGVDGFTPLAKEIRTANGGEIFYKGIARNITSLKSLAGVKKLWIEEGESVSEKSLKILTPSIRSTAAENEEDEDPPEIWITMNRGSSADAIAKKYLSVAEAGGLIKNGYYEDEMMMVVEVNWEDNPWFPPELEMERAYDYANLSRTEYDHIWGGQYNDSVDGAIISAEWFDACINVHKDSKFKGLFPMRGAVIAAHDPSDTGKDSKGFAARRGNVFLSIKEKYNCPIDEGCDWATESARALGADWFIWDGDGMGAGLKRQVALAFQRTRTMHHMFRGSLSGKAQDDGESIYMPTINPGDGSGAKKKYKDTFYNNRSRYYMDLADKFQATYRMVTKGEFIDPELLISIDSEGVENMKGLRAEVCRIPIKKNTIYNGLIQIMSKADMKKEQIESPGMADCMMMSLFSPPVMHHNPADLVPEYVEDY